MQCILLLYKHKDTLHLLMNNTNTRSYKYHYFYRIINKNTNQYYFGIHSTNNLNDNYMGSGTFLKKEYREHGKENFIKEILKFFDDRKTLLEYEKKIVNEDILSDPLCLNIAKGGVTSSEEHFTTGLVTVRDIHGNCFDVKKNDPRYLSGELQSVNKNMVTVRDKFGKIFKVSVADPRYTSGELIIISKGNKGVTGRIAVSKAGQNKFILKEELNEYISNGWVRNSTQKGRISPTKNKVWIYKDNVMKCVNKNNVSKYINDGWEKGRLVNTLKGQIGIMKDGVSKYIKPDELKQHILDGWSLGMKTRNKGKITVYDDSGKIFHVTKDDPRWINKEVKLIQFKNGSPAKGLIYINKNNNIKRVKPEVLQEYLNNGWSKGMKSKN